MKIEKFVYNNVKEDGTFENESGSVHTKPLIRMSAGEGCGSQGCHCSEGYWITIVLGRTPGGIVEGVKVAFKDKAEYDTFINKHELEA